MKLCTHQQNEEFDASCESCKNIVYQWKDFKLEIDNVQNLSKTDKNNKPSKNTVRVVTRQQERNTTACNWLGKYTNGEISTFQKEDQTFSFFTSGWIMVINQIEMLLLA